MKRVVVLGGLGLFGRTIVQRLTEFGITAQVAGRHPQADIQVEAENRASVHSAFRADDLVIDTAGPFHTRSMALVRSAIEIGFDVIDINDNLGYAQQVLQLESEIAGAGIRMLNSASTVSAITAAIVRQSGVAAPLRITTFLAPATRHTANRGTALSLIRSVGRPVQVRRDGRLQILPGWSEVRRFPMPSPVGPIRGRLFESADAIYQPRIWPSLQAVEMFVDTNTLGMNTLLRLAAYFPPLRTLLERQSKLGTRIARTLGSDAGGIGYEIEAADGRLVRFAVLSGKSAYVAAVAPAVLAARAIATGRFAPKGLVLPDQHVDPLELIEYLKSSGIEIVKLPADR